MRHWLRIALAAVLLAVLGFASSIADGALQSVRAQDHSAEFRETLGAYGRWIDHPRWGAVFIPADLPPDWRPYRFGHWVYTEAWGWYWVSDEEWGWITYHYGRWLWEHDLGWFWIPGDDWGPAWVNWRRGEDVVGWAPMPPDDYVIDDDLEPLFWSFVHPADIVAPSLAIVVLPVAQAPGFIQQTVFVNPTIVVRANDRVLVTNPGIPPAIIAAYTGHPLQTVAVEPHVIPGTVGVAGAVVGPPPSGRRESIKPQTTLIQPVAHIPAPTAYQPGQPAILDRRKGLQPANVTPATTPVAPKSPGLESMPTQHGVTPAFPPGPRRAAPNEPPSAPPSPMRPSLGVERGAAGTVHAPTPPMPPAPPALLAPRPPNPPVITNIPHPQPPPSRKCALVNGQQVCR